ncbi:MAG: Bax inhibitor-1 family protein [Planctomycetota bacterium]
MSQADNPYLAANFLSAAEANVDDRASFITKTYLHLAGAIAAFVLLVTALINSPFAEPLIQSVLGTRYGYLILFGGFMLVSWIAETWARSSTSLGMQYTGLGIYVVAEAIFMTPLMYLAALQDPNILATAGVTTLGLFAVLTTIVFITRKDFSFLRSVLVFGGFAAFGLILLNAFFGLTLGPIFTYAMIAFACAYILYDTSNVLHHYRTTQYVAASLALFASVALLFWYILQLFMSRD